MSAIEQCQDWDELQGIKSKQDRCIYIRDVEDGSMCIKDNKFMPDCENCIRKTIVIK